MATWTAVNAMVTKKLKQVEGVGITPGNINFSVEFFAEILKDGLFHHNYSGLMGVPADGDFQSALVKQIQGHLSLWANADGIEDNAELNIKGVIELAPRDPSPDNFTKAFVALQRAKALVDFEILSADDPSVISAKDIAQKAYKAQVNETPVSEIPLTPILNK